MGNEWSKPKYKSRAKFIISNQTIGRYAPQGQPVEVTWKQGGKEQSETLALQKQMTIEQTSDRLYIKVKPTLKGMQKVTLDIKERMNVDHKVTVCESQRVLGLTLAVTRMT